MYVSEEPQPEPYFRNPDFPYLLNHRAGMLSDFRVRRHENAPNIAIDFESVLFTGATSGSTSPKSMNSDAIAAFVAVGLVRTPVHRETVPIPTLTEEPTRQAFSVVPSDYCQLNCFTCRDCGHSTFTCPTLTPNQRMYFAYRYYLDQIEGNPTMAQFLEQKTERRVKLAKERRSTTLNIPQMSSDPNRPQSTRDETITDRVPWRAGPTNDIPALTITINVEATTAAEVSVEDAHEEEAYISATDAEYT